MGGFELVSSRVEGPAGRSLLFSEAAQAALTAPDPGDAGRIYVEYWGTAEGAAGETSLWIIVEGPAGSYRYDATGGLRYAVEDSDGGWSYAFSGAYWLADFPPAQGDGTLAIPPLHDGSFELVLRFWADRSSLYSVDLALTEA